MGDYHPMFQRSREENQGYALKMGGALSFGGGVKTIIGWCNPAEERTTPLCYQGK